MLSDLELLLRRLIREEIEAHEARRAAGDTSTLAVHDDVAELAAERAAKLRSRRGGAQ